MENDDRFVTEYWLVQYRQNLTACDTFNENTFEGPTQKTRQSWAFLTEDAALAFYTKRKNALKFAGCAGDYITYPAHHSIVPPHNGGAILEAMTIDGDYYEFRWHSTKEVCSRCRGNGTHVNPAVDGHGISPEEFAEDPDFKEAYFNGVYDVVCEECRGLRVVDVPDTENLPEGIADDYWRYEEEKRADAAEAEYERRMGC